MWKRLLENIKVNVQYFGLLKNTLGCEEEQFSLAKGSSVRDVMDLISDKHGEQFTSMVFRSDRTLRRLAQVMIDGDNIRDGNGLDTIIDDGHELSLTVGIYAIAGG